MEIGLQTVVGGGGRGLCCKEEQRSGQVGGGVWYREGFVFFRMGSSNHPN